MKVLVILFFVLSLEIAHAGEKFFFTKIPTNTPTVEAVKAVRQAAENRKWIVYEFENKQLVIKLDHRGYKANLKFYFSGNEIYYSDLTARFIKDVFRSGFNSKGGAWKSRTAPEDWVENLKSDTDIYLAEIEKIEISKNIENSFSFERIEKRLNNLKSLYDTNLITEAEYKLKKNEIMAEY